jgi:hypothetical protein
MGRDDVAVTPETSMVTNAEATAYFGGRLHADAWDAASDTDKDKALKTATRELNRLAFIGVMADPAQPHAFPRTYFAEPAMNAATRFHPEGSFTDDGIPQAVKDATCEQALFKLSLTAYERDRARQQAQGIIGGSVGPANEYSTNAYITANRFQTVLAPEVYVLLRGLMATVVDLG